MILLTTLTSICWLHTTNTVSTIMTKTVSCDRDIISAVRTHMRSWSSGNHMSQQAGDSHREIWEEQRSLEFCTVALLPWSIPSDSLCFQRWEPNNLKPASGMRTHAAVRKMWSDFFHPNIMETGWKGRRCKSLPIYGKQYILRFENASFPKAIHPQSWTVRQMSCCFLGGCYTLMPSLADVEMQNYLLTWAWKQLCSNWTEVIKCGLQIDSGYQ